MTSNTTGSISTAVVSKTMIESYRVTSGLEWASVNLREWSNEGGYGGEITINSSFGRWGSAWSACGLPFKQFLQKLDFDYFFGKLMGAALSKFDGDGTLKGMRERVIAARKKWLSYQGGLQVCVEET